MASDALAIEGGPRTIERPLPHFSWPPDVPALAEVVASYLANGGPLSIVDRSGIYGVLEDRFAELLGRRYAVLTNSGTTALYSAFSAAGIEQGDEVISTVYSFHATASPLLHLGAKVVFCDVEPDTGNIDPDHLASLATEGTRAVVTNDMWGHPVHKRRVGEVCRSVGARWIEDCSHAHFASYEGRYVGSFGDVGVFSLQGNKLLTGGEGGILLTNDEEIYRRATLLGHSLARSKQVAAGTEHSAIGRTGLGLKFRMHPLAAVIVHHLLEHHCFDWIAQRCETLDRFAAGLAKIDGIAPMARRDYVTSMGAHYGFKPRIDFEQLGITRERLVAALQAEGLDVSVPGSRPFHRLPLFDSEQFLINRFPKTANHGPFPGVERYYGSILSLPTFTFAQDWALVDAYIAGFDKVFNRLERLR